MTRRVEAKPPAIVREHYGRAGDVDVHRYILTNGNGVTARILDYGGVLQSLDVPDRDGNPANVVLGFSNLESYVTNNTPGAARVFFGALIGRYANRIAGGKFTLDGRMYQLPRNNGENSLHGGPEGFDTHVWSASGIRETDSVALRLTHLSPDGDQGFPGTLVTEVVYRLDERDRLTITYQATTNAPTVVNLTNHTYWNLAGEGSGDVYAQRLTINASRYSPVDASLIPSGEAIPVDGTPFDFREPTEIGARIDADHPQLHFGHGYDHNWLLDGNSFAAQASDPVSGRVLTMWTTEPGLQFYSGNFLTEALVGTGGTPYGPGAGFALEAQHFPNSPNRPDFPTTTLRPAQTYRQETTYAFTHL